MSAYDPNHDYNEEDFKQLDFAHSKGMRIAPKEIVYSPLRTDHLQDLTKKIKADNEGTDLPTEGSKPASGHLEAQGESQTNREAEQ